MLNIVNKFGGFNFYSYLCTQKTLLTLKQRTMNQTLLHVATDRFVQYAASQNINVERIIEALDACKKNFGKAFAEIDFDVYDTILDFGKEYFENENDVWDFLNEIDIPQNRYFHNVNDCLAYIQKKTDYIKVGHSIMLSNESYENNNITNVMVVKADYEILADYIILND